MYKGQWKDNRANGYGQYFHLEGAEYTGFWLNDRQNGRGKEIWPDGA